MPPDSQAITMSLKNIYRLLTKDDYPCPNAPVISWHKRRGLTLFAFWRDILAADTAVTSLGEKLWNTDTRRNRYLSDLFNRSHPVAFYTGYFDTVSALIEPAVLLNIIRRMAGFLQDAAYDRQALNARLSCYLELIAQQDSEVIPAVHTFFSNLLWKAPEFDTDADRGCFFDAYVLSMLALHAFFGLQMNNGPMGRLRRDTASQPEALFESFRSTLPGTGHQRPEFLTGQACELCREPLDNTLFFGRDSELEDLREQIRQGGKILISGMGGIGKTELLRQALKISLREGLFASVAYVQYEGSLRESFLRSFLDLHGNTMETRFEECVQRLSRGKGRNLLLIDNMNTPRHEDAALGMLSGLGCDIVMTSRLASLSGFRTFMLDNPGRKAARQIFGANYGQPLEQDEESLLIYLLDEHLDCHPLMCTVLGSMARSRHLDIPTLYNGLRNHGLKGGFTQEAQSVQVEDVLHRLFELNNLDEKGRSLLRLFALLPQRLYPFFVLQELMADITQDKDELADSLETLRYLGWLGNSVPGYSMHPVIAESLLATKPKTEEYPRFWACLDSRIQLDKYREWVYVEIAHHALLRSDIDIRQARRLLNTALLLTEQGLFSASENLLEAAGEIAGDPGLNTASFSFELNAIKLHLLRGMGQFDGADILVREVIRLYPDTDESDSRPFGLGNALFFAVSLSMGEEVQELYDALAGTQWASAEETALCCYTMSEFHAYATRNYTEMVAWAEKGLDILKSINRLHTLEAANLYHARALGFAYSGRPEAAQADFRLFNQLYQDWFGDSDAMVFAISDNSLGVAYDQAGEYAIALEHFFKALNTMRKIVRKDSYMTESYLNNIANVYFHQKNFEQAITFSQKAYEMHRRLNRVENLQTSLLLNNMGCYCRDSGRPDDARGLFEESRRIAALLAGETSIPYAEPSFNLGQLCLLAGQKSEAARLLEWTVPVFEASYGPEHPRTKMAKRRLEEANHPDENLS